MVGNAISLFQNLQSLKTTNNLIEQSWRVIDRLQYVNVLVMDAESSTRGYFMSADPVYLGPWKTAKAELGKEFDGLEQMLSQSQSQMKNLAQLRALARTKLEIIEEAIKIYQESGLDEIMKRAKAGKGREVMDDLRLLVVVMTHEQNELQTARKTRFYEEYKDAVLVGMATNAIAILILILFYRLIYRNISKRLNTEKALLCANDTLESTVLARTEQLSVLSRHLINVAEEEKAKLARELHDELGASLTAINMDIAAVAQQLKRNDPPLSKQLDRARQTLLETVDLKRRIVENLRPSVLDNLGLSTSLRQHCEQFQEITGIQCEVNIPEDFDRIDSIRSITLFRITQESLTNIVKYAHASRVEIFLDKDQAGLRLRIYDNGIGIPKDALTKPKSHGLTGMRERTLLLGGTFTIGRGDNHQGTRIEVFIPNKSDSDENV